MPEIDYQNSTRLNSDRLLMMCRQQTIGWRTGTFTLRIRYSRGSDFSGSCYYADRKIFVNLGRHLTYPYQMGTLLARGQSYGDYWYKPLFTIELASGYEVVLFVFLHELYHLLTRRAGRNTRQKESMCDRFAARVLVDRYGATVRTEKGRPARREDWDFQDLERFVGAARDRRVTRGRRGVPEASAPHADNGQLLLFPVG